MIAKDKLITARVRLQKDNPFFSYLVLGLELKEDNSIESCAVDGKGNLFYNPEWIEECDNEQVKTILAHEVLHIALQHLAREKKRDRKTFNIACDIVVNNLLEQNNFVFGDLDGARPNNNEIPFRKTVIKNIDKKIAEEIYNELDAPEKKQDKKGKGKSSDKKGKGKEKTQSSQGDENSKELNVERSFST